MPVEYHNKFGKKEHWKSLGTYRRIGRPFLCCVQLF